MFWWVTPRPGVVFRSWPHFSSFIFCDSWFSMSRGFMSAMPTGFEPCLVVPPRRFTTTMLVMECERVSKGLLTFYLPKAHLKQVLFEFESNKIPYKSWICTVPSRATCWKQVRRHVTLMFKPECVAEFEMHHLSHVQMQPVFILTSFYLRVVCSTLSHNRLDKENLTWSCHSSAFHHQSL